MMVNSYYGIYQAERGKTAAGIRAADARLGGLAAELGQLGPALAAPARGVRRSLRRQRPPTDCIAEVTGLAVQPDARLRERLNWDGCMPFEAFLALWARRRSRLYRRPPEASTSMPPWVARRARV
jgi:hypothetical protein